MLTKKEKRKRGKEQTRKRGKWKKRKRGQVEKERKRKTVLLIESAMMRNGGAKHYTTDYTTRKSIVCSF